MSEEVLMKKRWGVRVIAILMLIAGLLLFLLGILPAIRVAVQGAGTGLGVWLAIPSALFGCAGALFLLVAGSVLLTVGKIAENFAATRQPAPVKSAEVAAPVTVAAPEVAESSIVDRPSPPQVAAVAALPAATVVPKAKAAGMAVVEPAAAGLLASAIVAEEQPAPAEVTPVGEIIEETQAPAALEATAPELADALPEAVPTASETAAETGFTTPEEVAPAAEQVAKAPAVEGAIEAVKPEPMAPPSPREGVSALQAQLAALQAQLDELEGAPPAAEELPLAVEDEGPAPGATADLKLPGAEDAARVAAEMAALHGEAAGDA
jgi:hypothetical protein